MKKIIYIFILSFFVVSCEKNGIGYLVTDTASYSVNKMQVRLELDLREPTYTPYLLAMWEQVKDSGQYENIYEFFIVAGKGDPQFVLDMGGQDLSRKSYELPWETLTLEGVRGTMPIKIYVHSVDTKDGDANAMLESLKVRGDGTMTIPFIHSIPVGVYVISLRVENEGKTNIISDCYTFEVVQKYVEEVI